MAAGRHGTPRKIPEPNLESIGGRVAVTRDGRETSSLQARRRSVCGKSFPVLSSGSAASRAVA